jgi:hypothetical protein
MDNILLYNKLTKLPESMKAEVSDFVDFLLSKTKTKKQTQKRPKFGSIKGAFKMKKNFDDPIEEFKDYQ